MIATSSDPLQKSSALLGYMYLQKSLENFETFRKMFGNIRLVFGHILENLRKSLENGCESLQNCQKR